MRLLRSFRNVRDFPICIRVNATNAGSASSGRIACTRANTSTATNGRNACTRTNRSMYKLAQLRFKLRASIHNKLHCDALSLSYRSKRTTPKFRKILPRRPEEGKPLDILSATASDR